MERTQTLSMSTIEVSPDGAMIRYSFFEPHETVLRELIDDLFLNHWSIIVFGVLKAPFSKFTLKRRRNSPIRMVV